MLKCSLAACSWKLNGKELTSPLEKVTLIDQNLRKIIQWSKTQLLGMFVSGILLNAGNTKLKRN